MSSQSLTDACPNLHANLHEFHTGLTDWIEEKGGFDEGCERCAMCEDPQGPFTAGGDESETGALCLLCAARFKGCEEGEAETVDTVLEALGVTPRSERS